MYARRVYRTHTAAMDPSAVLAALIVAVILMIAMREQGHYGCPEPSRADGSRGGRVAAPPRARPWSPRRGATHGTGAIPPSPGQAPPSPEQAVLLYPCWLDDEPARQGITSASAILNHIDRIA